MTTCFLMMIVLTNRNMCANNNEESFCFFVCIKFHLKKLTKNVASV